MTPDFFERQIERLKPLGEASDEFKDTYWGALRDIPPDVFEAAVTHALKTRVWFPKPAELRRDADHVAVTVRPVPAVEQRATELAQPFTITIPQIGSVVSVQREWKYYCDKCHDGGWESVWCGSRAVVLREDTLFELAKPWQESMRCDRRNEHGTHEWVRRCSCWETNPALVRKRESQRKYAETPGKVA